MSGIAVSRYLWYVLWSEGSQRVRTHERPVLSKMNLITQANSHPTTLPNFPHGCLSRLEKLETIGPPLEISLVFIGYFALGTFRRRSLFRWISYQFRYHFRIIFSSIFMTFSASIFASIFSSIFDGLWIKTAPNYRYWASLFSSLFATFSFMLILCCIWSPFGSLLAPVGSLLAPFGSLRATFGTLWITFGSILGP